MKSWDVIIIGGGIIGLSLAIELRKQRLRVLIVERGEPGREASHAAAGMLAAAGDEFPAALKPLAEESARMYPEFAHELEDESGLKVDLREQGTIVISCDGNFPAVAEPLSPQRMRSLEPSLRLPCEPAPGRGHELLAAHLPERSVDPRALVAAAIKAARHRDVDISSGTEVKALLVGAGRVSGVKTERTSYSAGVVVNCAGAWAGSIQPWDFPVKPIKGQMLAVVGGPALKHVVRAKHVYLVPRTDGRLVIGSTLEDTGFGKQTDINTLEQLFEAALELVPGLAESRRNEAWAGLRPGTPDELPILGETSTSGFFVATGHYRDGILLAPVTACIMADLLLEGPAGHDLTPFSPGRFGF
jgi:glycine oxidase ThiO